MTVCVFTGPTLSAAEGLDLLDAEYLRPAAQGDVYRAALRRPFAIGIIDGYFERVPAVWHKEILWAMSRDIHVFGSASMGALRAAELHQFGMVGVGKTFEAYRDGELEDDDEVAVAHGPETDDFTPYSQALVNIRATLSSAQRAGIISARVHHALLDAGKATFYADRTYALLLRRGEEAVAMLAAMRGCLERGRQPKRVRYYFEPTIFWDRACRSAARAGAGRANGARGIDDERALDELRLDGTRYRETWLQTLGRVLATDEARRLGAPLTGDAVQRSADSFRRERALLTSEETADWMQDNGLTEETFTAPAEQEALLRFAASWLAPRVAASLANALRSSGEFRALVDRALDKQRLLEERGLGQPALEDTGLTGAELLRWYVDECLGGSSDAGAAELARRAGFAEVDACRRAVIREFCYRRECAKAASAGSPALM
jgi:hypothetical protein